MKIINGGITAVKGISTLGKAIGIKKSGKKDLAVIYSEKLANVTPV